MKPLKCIPEVLRQKQQSEKKEQQHCFGQMNTVFNQRWQLTVFINRKRTSTWEQRKDAGRWFN